MKKIESSGQWTSSTSPKPILHWTLSVLLILNLLLPSIHLADVHHGHSHNHCSHDLSRPASPHNPDSFVCLEREADTPAHDPATCPLCKHFAAHSSVLAATPQPVTLPLTAGTGESPFPPQTIPSPCQRGSVHPRDPPLSSLS
jgi:hypothetical protein